MFEVSAFRKKAVGIEPVVVAKANFPEEGET
jgi:hypothetical protein